MDIACSLADSADTLPAVAINVESEQAGTSNRLAMSGRPQPIAGDGPPTVHRSAETASIGPGSSTDWSEDFNELRWKHGRRSLACQFCHERKVQILLFVRFRQLIHLANQARCETADPHPEDHNLPDGPRTCRYVPLVPSRVQGLKPNTL